MIFLLRITGFDILADSNYPVPETRNLAAAYEWSKYFSSRLCQYAAENIWLKFSDHNTVRKILGPNSLILFPAQILLETVEILFNRLTSIALLYSGSDY